MGHRGRGGDHRFHRLQALGQRTKFDDEDTLDKHPTMSVLAIIPHKPPFPALCGQRSPCLIPAGRCDGCSLGVGAAVPSQSSTAGIGIGVVDDTEAGRIMQSPL